MGLGVVVTEVAPGDTVPVGRGVPVLVITVTVVCGVPETGVPVGAGTGGVGVVTGWPAQKPALRYLQSK